MAERRFLDASIFVNRLKTTPAIAIKDETAATSGHSSTG